MKVTPEITRRARVSKTVNDLMCGVTDDELLSDLYEISVPPAEAAEILAEAKERMPQVRSDYRRAVRSSAIWYLGLGVAAMILISLIDPEKVPALRQGRYIGAWALAIGSSAYGAFKYIFPEFDVKPIRNRYAAKNL
jgi:hypothetical protein